MISRFTPSAKFAWALAASCGALFSSRAVAQNQSLVPQYQPTEYSTGTPFPVDVAATLNGRRSAVRSAISTGTTSGSYANGITLWDLTGVTPSTLPLGAFVASGEGPSIGLFGYEASDRIELTSNRGIATGSGFFGVPGAAQDTTYIDVFDAGPTPAMLASHVIAPGANAYDAAGYANDVAITPDGAFAVCNSDNWIHLIDMGTGAIAVAFNIGVPGYGPSPTTWTPDNLCSPNHAVDSVAVTNDFAVVSTARIEGAGMVTWVYILNLNTQTIVLEQRIAPGGGPAADEFVRPHDVAITRDGELAVVTMHRMIALFDLVSVPPQMIGVHYDEESSRQYQLQVDSVELTNNRAVIIADRMNLTTNTPYWQAEVWEITRVAPGPYLNLLVQYSDPNFPDGVASGSHDLAVTDEDTQALVRTSFDNVFITDVNSPPAQPALPALPSPNGSDAYAYDFSQYGSAVNYRQFSSDAVTIGPRLLVSSSGGVNVYRQIAATIGGSANLLGNYQGHVDFIDLAAGTPTVTQQTIVSSSTGFGGCVPLDLVLTRDKTQLVVRSADYFPDAPTASGVDLMCFSIATLNPIIQFGGTGYVTGLDSVAAGNNGMPAPSTQRRTTSISEDPASPRDGKVHIVSN